MDNNATTLTALARTAFGKGSARQARRASLVPAVVYGHGTEPRHVLLPAHDTAMALRGNENALIELDVDGETLLVLTKDVQRHPIRPGVQHVDFVLVNRDEKVEVEVPVVVVGEPTPGTMHIIELAHLLVSAPAVSIPENIEVNVEGIEGGNSVRVADLSLPEGVLAVTDAETDVVNVVLEQIVEEEPAAEAPAEGEPASE